MTAKNPQKQGRILEGGGKNFSGWPEYIPLFVCMSDIYDSELARLSLLGALVFLFILSSIKVINDFDIEEEEIAITDREDYLMKIQKRVNRQIIWSD